MALNVVTLDQITRFSAGGLANVINGTKTNGCPNSVLCIPGKSYWVHVPGILPCVWADKSDRISLCRTVEKTLVRGFNSLSYLGHSEVDYRMLLPLPMELIGIELETAYGESIRSGERGVNQLMAEVNSL